MARITEMRSALLKEMLLNRFCNNESFITYTVGIPDGDSFETVLDDMRNGDYDFMFEHEYGKKSDYDVIRTLNWMASRHGGFWINGEIKCYDTALRKMCELYPIPARIYKKR